MRKPIPNHSSSPGARAHIPFASSHTGMKFGKKLDYLQPGFEVRNQEEPTTADPRPRRVKHRIGARIGKEPK